MKIKIEITPDAAKDFLREFETKWSEKLREREGLNAEIQQLEESVKNLREQLQGANGAGARAPRGENRKRIMQYLRALPDGKGARMTEIAKSTGISMASTNFTLKHNKKDFIKDENGVWRAK